MNHKQKVQCFVSFKSANSCTCVPSLLLHGIFCRKNDVLCNADAELMHEAQIEGSSRHKGLHPFARDG